MCDTLSIYRLCFYEHKEIGPIISRHFVPLMLVLLLGCVELTSAEDHLKVGLELKSRTVDFGDKIEFSIQFANVGKLPIEIKDPRLSQAYLDASVDPRLLLQRRKKLSAICIGTPTLAEVKNRNFAGLGPPTFVIHPNKPRGLEGQYQMDGTDLLFPGLWRLQIVDSENGIKSNVCEVGVRIGKQSIPFLAKTIVSPKTKLFQRRRLSRFLELVDPAFHPRWPHPADTGEVRIQKHKIIENRISEIVTRWNALSENEQNESLAMINRFASDITTEIFLR